MRLALLLALAFAAIAAPLASGYEHLGEQIGTQVLPKHWRTLPIDLTVDNGPTNIQGEVAIAVNTWNGVPTAKDPWGAVSTAPVDFTKDNMGTAWGDLSGDGRQEVVFDEDGSILTQLGFDPVAVNGFGLSAGTIHNGAAELDDMYLLINGSRTTFDRRATEVHELGHTLGLAHSSVGFPLGKDGALEPVLESEVPTMHPFSISGTDRRTLEPDDVASLSELYPEPSFATTTGTITGTVTRCDGGAPVLGANVRAINVADPAIQLSRMTGFDGATDGSYTISGVPPGDYDVVVEPLAGDADYVAGLVQFTRVDTDFTQEFLNRSKEGDCAQDTDPTVRESIPVGATGNQTADFQVASASLALVIDVTGSMGPEIGAIKTGLNAMIAALQNVPGGFPLTAIVTFEDSATIRVVSSDPNRLKTVIDGLTLHSTSDCPEGSNAGLMTAGRLLGSGGRAILVTDAESHPTGPTREAVDDLFASKGARLTVLLSGSCPPPPMGARASAPAAGADPLPGAGPDQARPVHVLGNETSVRTFSEESLFSGGLFSFQPEIKTDPNAATRYANTLANVGISAVTPALAAVNPAALPQGTAPAVELIGSDTGFRPGSTVAVAGGGVTVTSVDALSPTRLVARVAVAPGAAAGFRDVTVTTDRGDGTLETATGIGAVQVVGAPATPTVLSVTPSELAVGTTRDVTISGGLTHFGAGSVASLGAGVTVSHLTADSPTSATASVTVAPGAAIGFRDVTVQTGGELARETVTGPLLVTAAPPAVARLTGAAPRSGARGTTVDVALTGAGTAFASGSSAASVSGAGVDVLSTTVLSPTSAVARLRIATGAPLGFRDLRVATGAQTAALLDGFEITPAPTPAATPTPTAAPRPPAAVPPIACVDRAAPSVAIAAARVTHGRLAVSGRASDTGCRAAVARVELAISRAAPHRRCRFVTSAGRLGAPRRCTAAVWLPASGTTRWSLRVKRGLPRATYTLQARARDAAGNLGKAKTRSARVA